MFARVPIAPVVGEDEEKLSIKDMLKTKAFWIFMVLILCAGSSEQAVSQWASTFCRKGARAHKDRRRPCGPDALLDSYGRFALHVRQVRQQDKSRFNDAPERLRLHSFLFSHFADLIACARARRRCRVRTFRRYPLAGHDRQNVLGATRRRNGRCTQYSAWAGDIGCSAGPTFAGMMASAFGDDLKKAYSAPSYSR